MPFLLIIPILCILFSLALGIITAMIGAKKGRSSVIWFLYGVLFWFIALPHALLASDLNKRDCPKCGQKVSIKAQTCPFCHNNLIPIPKPSKLRTTQFYIVIVLYFFILIMINGYFYYHRTMQQFQTANTEGPIINQDSTRIADLDARYHAEMDSLYSYKGQNATLDSLLRNKINQLSVMGMNLDQDKENGKLDEFNYEKDIDALNSLVNDLKNQITDLQGQNHILIERSDSINNTLMKENDSLGKSLEIPAGTMNQKN